MRSVPARYQAMPDCLGVSKSLHASANMGMHMIPNGEIRALARVIGMTEIEVIVSKLKNGLTDRQREVKISIILTGIAGGYLLLCLVAPATIASDTVPELSGRANAIDYANHDSWGNKDHGEGSTLGHDQSLHGGSFAWTDLNPAWASVYAIGDLNCHQKHQRSWEVNGNQMPVCVRDIGIMLGFAIGSAIFGYRGLNRWTVRDTFLSVLPDERLTALYARDSRLIAVIVIMCIGLVPMAIDGFTQLLMGSYESTNPVRLVTGFAAGLVAGWWFTSAFAARPKFFEGASEVTLPADARLVIK
ncbi:MAG: DUF2085 domain-containing protein [Candidatus Thalassarchaeaceae archaeon]|nr:hypothetical protein [Euryarchaeota archaeon]MDP7091413.1 DUF2085 domain-containing protein [Candidatus Thalassarchaeaceae archaeon]MDP7257288.1 DUF2085 domain-containing protein [Candidatus Thalassarchaeaceae archaeon]MDP7446532.1 DUF2085 domain-containing protein [Candidatus Thalassarchaeaceae archaeon]MDP7648627.1 DUF2085 domain-containing protein [Candidatus Thalassarchaeaceae archaeon]